MSDPHFASVVYLAVNENGTDGSTTFVDQSAAARTITTVGNAQWDTAKFPTGMSSSLLLDGTGDYLSAADSTDWDFGTGDFTVEFMVLQASLVASPQSYVANYGTSTTGWLLQLRTDGTDRLVSSTSGDTPLDPYTWAVGTDSWYHVAWARASSVMRCFVDGVQVGSDVANTEDITGSTAICAIGRLGALNLQYVNGSMACVRVTKGVARYTGAFTPPSLPLPTTGESPPVAAFSGTPLSGTTPLSVAFTDASTNTPTSWLWEKNDGGGWVNFAGTPTAQNPTEDFTTGTWDVRLTATNGAGSDTETKNDYIVASAAVAATVSGGGGSGKQYRTHTDWDTQREKKRKALEARVEKLEKRIALTSKKLSESREVVSQKKLEELASQLRKLQKLLLDLLAQLDEMNKSLEESELEEVMNVYMVYRMLH